MKRILLSLLALGSGISAADAKLNVVATTPDLAAIVRAVGGDQIDLTTLGKPAEDPHFVDAKPSFIVKLNHADALVEGGADLEIGWLPALLEGARNPKLELGKPGRIACNEGIALLEVPSSLDRSKGDVHAAGNPHYLTDPMNAKIVAQHIGTSLSALDSAHATLFQANVKRFNDALDAKFTEWQRQLAPFKGTTVVAYHNFWPYFAQRFDLKMDLVLEPKPGIPPTPAHLAEVIGRVKADHLKVIIVQPYQNRRTAEAVAQHSEAKIVDFPSFPTGDQSYDVWMDGLVKSLAAALGAEK
jgi:zinc/manganese transport system substrate-binding protein